MSTLIRRDNKWSQVAGGTRLWTGTRAQLDKELAAGTLPDYTQVMVTDDYPNELMMIDIADKIKINDQYKDKIELLKVGTDNGARTYAARSSNVVNMCLSFTYKGTENIRNIQNLFDLRETGLPKPVLPLVVASSYSSTTHSTHEHVLGCYLFLYNTLDTWWSVDKIVDTERSRNYYATLTYLTDDPFPEEWAEDEDNAVVTPDVNSDEIPSNAVTNQLSTIATCDSQYNISGLYWYTVDSHKNVTLLVRNAGVATDSSKENIYIEKGKIPVPANPTSVQGVQLIDEATHEVNGNVWFDKECKLNIRQDNNGNTFRFLLQYRSV